LLKERDSLHVYHHIQRELYSLKLCAKLLFLLSEKVNM